MSLLKRLQALTPDELKKRVADDSAWLEKHGRSAVSARSVAELSEFIGELMREQRDQLAALEKRVKDLESRPAGLRYRGVFKHGETYDVGDVTTHQGSMWCATARTAAQPGLSTHASRSWTLCVKRGQDTRSRDKNP
jgi:hypothetical protein